MEPTEYLRMFSLEADYWWYRALRRRVRRSLHAVARLARSAAAEKMKSTSPDAAAPACLDAGCGTGMLLAALGRDVRAYGVDASRHALALARSRNLPHLALAGVEELPFREGAFEIMISADVLYHRAVRDDLAALREAARCLQPGGILVLNLPAFAWLRSRHDEVIHTARRYTAREVREKLIAAGLTPLRVRYWNSLLFPPLVAVRLLRRGWRTDAPAAPAHSDLAPLPRWLNETLAAILRLEEALDFIAWPAGLSVLAVARKEQNAPRSSLARPATPPPAPKQEG